MDSDVAVDEDIRKRVECCVVEGIVSFGANRSQVTPQASLADLDTDLLDLLELSQLVDEEFGVRIRARDADAFETVEDAIDLILTRLR